MVTFCISVAESEGKMSLNQNHKAIIEENGKLWVKVNNLNIYRISHISCHANELNSEFCFISLFIKFVAILNNMAVERSKKREFDTYHYGKIVARDIP